MSFGNNPIEELPASAELHNQINRMPVLEHGYKLHNILVASEMMHYLNFSPHVLDIVFAVEFPRGDGLAGELAVSWFAGD